MNQLILYFALMGFAGWVYETAAMTLWGGKWDNRGFLFGPVLPIYALGGLAVSLVFDHLMPQASMLQIFLLGMLGSSVLEFVTSLVLERIFHQTWWDYSICPGNLQGRICIPAAMGFGIAAILVNKLVNPGIFRIIGTLSDRWCAALAMVYALVLLLDLSCTVYSLKFRPLNPKHLEFFNDRMDRLVEEHYPLNHTPSEFMREKLDR